MGFLTAASLAFAETLPWYEGGTLQKANVGAWLAATPENQLATSGDFIASLSAIPDLSKVTGEAEMANLKKRAMELRDCVNQTISSSDMASEAGVAELVVMCTLLKPAK